MPCPLATRSSFLAHEPIANAAHVVERPVGGAGFAVLEQAQAVNALVGGAVEVLCPAGGAEPKGFEARTFEARQGSLDELADLYGADATWQRRFDTQLRDGVVLAHHLPAARVLEALRRPFLVALHSLWPCVQAALTGAPEGRRGPACASLLRSAAGVLVSTEAERAWLLRTAPADVSNLAARVHVIPQGPSPEIQRLAGEGDLAALRNRWRSELVPRAQADDIVLYAVGRRVPYKRPLELVRSFVRVAREAPRAHLLLVGDDTDAATAAACREVVQKAPKRIANRIQIVGPMPLGAAHLAGDVLVHPSRFETWGRVIDEALILGRPTVLANSPFVAERVVGPALWIDASQEDELDAALQRAVTDVDWRAACGAANRDLAQTLGWEAPARALLTVWNDVEERLLGVRPFELPAEAGVA